MRERERERLDTLIPGVPLNLYRRSFLVTIKHSLPHNKHIYTEKRILRYRDRHEDEREGGEREREKKKHRERFRTQM